MVRFKLSKSLLKGMTDILKGGIIEEPRWFQVVSKVPPDPPLPEGRTAKKIHWPEDQLIRAYYKRNPESRRTPVSFAAGAPMHPARAFARRQLELMQSGLGYKDALKATEQETAEAARGGGGKAGEEGEVSVIRAVQAAEEQTLHLAMRKAHEQGRD